MNSVHRKVWPDHADEQGGVKTTAAATREFNDNIFRYPSRRRHGDAGVGDGVDREPITDDGRLP